MKPINRILGQAMHPQWGRFIFVIALVLLGVGFETIAPWPFKILIDNVLGSQPIDATGWLGQMLNLLTSREVLGFFAVLVYCFSSLSVSITDYFVALEIKILGNNLINDFSRRAFDNVQQLAVGYYRKQEIGDYIYRLSYDVSALGNLFESGIIPIVTHTLYLILTAAIMFWIDRQLSFVALIMVPLLVAGLAVFNRRIGSVSKRSELSNSTLFSFIEEVLGQLKIIQAFNQQKRESELFKEKEGVSLSHELDMYGLDYLLNLFIGVIIAVGYSLIIVYGIKDVFLGRLSTGVLIVFIFYLDNLTNPLLSLMNASSSLRQDYTKISRLNDFFSPKFHIKDTGLIATLPPAAITFTNVSVYGDERVPILKNISFTIPVDKKTVIVGVSGSGKTTIASLILRFIEPAGGAILIGDKNINRYSLKSLRDATAYVPQEIVLFNDTVRNNIAFGNPRATDDDIRAAARLAVADAFIGHLPGGYDFNVGEEGANLSGGQRQRLMLARAFVKKNARLVIMDEPLSSLDIKTSAAFMENINRFSQGKTTIIISNVLKIISQADHVIVVNEGEVMHAGSAASLLKESHLASVLLHST